MTSHLQSDRVRTLLAHLVAGGLRHLVVSPGSRSTPLVQAAAERAELTLHVVLDERAAGFFALGLTRATGHLCGTLCTSGSAVAHLLPAAIEGVESGDRLLALTADRPVDVRGLGAPQAILQPGLLAPYATHFVEILPLSEEFSQQLTALDHALTLLPAHGGLLHLNVPLGLPLALAAGVAPLLPAPPQPVQIQPGPPIPAPQPGERVLLVAGALPDLPGLAHFLRDRLDPGQVVLLAEPASRLRDALPGIRHADALLHEPDLRRHLQPDRIVRLGAWPVAKGLQLLLEDAARREVLVDVAQPRRISDPLRQNRLTSTDVPEVALREWPLVQLPTESPWQKQWQDADLAIQPPPPGLHEGQIIAALAPTLPAQSTVVLGNSMPVRDWHTFAPILPPTVHIEVSRGAAGIDGTLATAAGLAIGRRHPVTVYLGDATFLHDCGSLQLLAQLHFGAGSVRVVVVDNGGGAIFDYLPARTAMSSALHERFFTAPHTLRLDRIAQGFGIDARNCASISDLRACLSTPLAHGEVQVLVVSIDRIASETMHRHYWRASAKSARSALGIES